MDVPDIIAIHDQAKAEVVQKARLVGAYFMQLRAEGIEEYEATRLTLAFQRRLIFPDQPAEVSDGDDD